MIDDQVLDLLIRRPEAPKILDHGPHVRLHLEPPRVLIAVALLVPIDLEHRVRVHRDLMISGLGLPWFMTDMVMDVYNSEE